ncbi:class I SAM-dependent methyltransferase [Kitasatospora sp. NPDC008115]|uniref:class I SAM-dependent methyltransferase n=1 Tax=Kitasatospora sp. NPDC008115 TaxID=3364022 RepID=UPI0036E62E21
MENAQAGNYDDLVKFYRGGDRAEPSIFEVWEDGGSRGDSVTPSTFSSEYRDWMCDKLVAELGRNGGGLLSLGAGNAAVEAQVAAKGFRVLALDAMEEAVELARRKGLEAVRADIYQWEPEESWSVIYIDGVLGHLHRDQGGLVPVLTRIRSWLTPQPGSPSGRAALIASNDAPKVGADVQKAPGVNGFHWLAGDYMRAQAVKSGFDSAVAEEFRYQRPVSGERTRAIVTGYVIS